MHSGMEAAPLSQPPCTAKRKTLLHVAIAMARLTQMYNVQACVFVQPMDSFKITYNHLQVSILHGMISQLCSRCCGSSCLKVSVSAVQCYLKCIIYRPVQQMNTFKITYNHLQVSILQSRNAVVASAGGIALYLKCISNV